MRIESGTTGERRTRLLIFLAMCVVFAGWFGYDGMWGYPKKNLNWAMEAMDPKPSAPKTNPRAMVATLRKVSKEMSRQEIEALLGEPLLVVDRKLTYLGPRKPEGERFRAVFKIAEGKVTEIDSETVKETVDGGERVADGNPRVSESGLAGLEVGMAEEEIRRRLGKPTEVQPQALWYVGPAAYGKFSIENGRVVGEPLVMEQREPSEGDIFVQRVLAIVLGILALVMLIKFILVLRTRVVVDDSGLTRNGKHIPWDAMVGLNDEEYTDKAWLDLEYQQNGATHRLRLDSYHIAKFEAIVEAICAKKGFASPMRSRHQADSPMDFTSEATSTETPTESEKDGQA